MSWTNAFDLGPCQLAVRRTGTLYWFGTLGKGESSPTFDGYFPGEEILQVNVSVDGVASLVAVDGSTNNADGYALTVTPQFDLTGASLRVSGISIASDAAYAAQAWSNIGSPVALTPPDDWVHWEPTTVTPDPADVTEADALSMTVMMGAGV